MARRELKNVLGDITEYKRLIVGSFRHIDELTKDRIFDHGEFDFDFHAADGAVYFVEEGIPKLALTRERANPILRNIGPALREMQVYNWGGYVLSPRDFDLVLEDPHTLVVDLNNLLLQEDKMRHNDLGFLSVRIKDRRIFDGNDYVLPNSEQENLLTRLGHTSEYLSLLASGEIKADKPLEEIHVTPFLPKVVLDHFVEAPIAFSTCLYGGDFRFSVSLASYRGPEDTRYLRGLWHVEKQRTSPTFHEIMNCLRNDIAPSVLPGVEKRIHHLYQKIEAERKKSKYGED